MTAWKPNQPPVTPFEMKMNEGYVDLQREKFNGIIDHRLFSVYDAVLLIQERIVGRVSCDMTMTRTHQSGPSGCR